MNWYFAGSGVGALITVIGVCCMIYLKKTNRWYKKRTPQHNQESNTTESKPD